MWEARQTEDSWHKVSTLYNRICSGMVFDRLGKGNQRSRYTDETVSPGSVLKTIYSL